MRTRAELEESLDVNMGTPSERAGAGILEVDGRVRGFKSYRRERIWTDARPMNLD
jgi:hypothetical protein